MIDRVATGSTADIKAPNRRGSIGLVVSIRAKPWAESTKGDHPPTSYVREGGRGGHDIAMNTGTKYTHAHTRHPKKQSTRLMTCHISSSSIAQIRGQRLRSSHNTNNKYYVGKKKLTHSTAQHSTRHTPPLHKDARYCCLCRDTHHFARQIRQVTDDKRGDQRAQHREQDDR